MIDKHLSYDASWEHYFQHYFKRSFIKMTQWIPPVLKTAGNTLWQHFSAWFCEQLITIETAKSPWEEQDKRFYNALAHLIFDELEEKILAHPETIENVLPELIELQGILGKFTASPYLYTSLLESLYKALQQSGQIAVANKINTFLLDFKQALKRQPIFSQECLEGDLCYVLQEVCRHKMGMSDLITYIKFYEPILPAYHYVESLLSLNEFYSANKLHFQNKMGKEQCVSFEHFLTEHVQTLITQHREELLHTQQTSKEHANAFAALPYENINIPEEMATWPESASNLSQNYFIKSLQVAKKLINFTLEHPLQAIAFGLAAQTAAAAALSPLTQSFSMKEDDLDKRIITAGIPPEFQVFSPLVGNATQTAIVTQGTNFSILFSTYNNTNMGIFVQPYGWNAQPLQQSLQINGDLAYNQTAPSAIFQNGEYRVLWQRYGNATTQNDIVYGRFNSNWTAITPQAIFNSQTQNDQSQPRIAMSSNGALAVWASYYFAAPNAYSIVSKTINLNGTFSGPDNLIAGTIDNQTMPDAAASNSNYLVVWQTNYGAGYGYEIWGNTVYLNGTVSSPSYVTINSETPGDQLHPSVASNGNIFLVAFESAGNILARFVNPNLSFPGPDFRVNTNTAIGHSYPKAILKNNGNFLITYQCYIYICAQELTSNGTFVGNEVQLNTDFSGTYGYPTAAPFPSGDPKDLVVAWENYNAAPNAILARVFNNTSLDPTVAASTQSTQNGMTSNTQQTSTQSTNIPSSLSDGMTTNLEQTMTQSKNTDATSVTVPSSMQQATTDYQSHQSSSHNNGTSPLAIGLGVGVSSVAVLLGTLGGIYACKRHRRHLKEMAQNHPNENALALNRLASSGPVMVERIESTPSQIGRYILLNKVNQEIADQLYSDTGIKVKFLPNKHKIPYKLGQGQFGKVKLARDTVTNKLVGVKKTKDNMDNVREAELQTELSKEENIMPLFYSARSKDSDGLPAIYNFMPLAGFGNGIFLAQCLSKLKDERTRQKILITFLCQLLNGIANMHKHKIYHNDLKPENIMFDKSGNLYIIDFGCAAKTNDGIFPSRNKVNGDTRYFSSQRLQAPNFHAERNELWAAGVAMLQIACGGIYPFESMSKERRYEECTPDYFKAALDAIPEMHKNASDTIYRILKEELLIPDPNSPCLDAARILSKIKMRYPHLILDRGYLGTAFEQLLVLSEEVEVIKPKKAIGRPIRNEHYLYEKEKFSTSSIISSSAQEIYANTDRGSLQMYEEKEEESGSAYGDVPEERTVPMR